MQFATDFRLGSSRGLPAYTQPQRQRTKGDYKILKNCMNGRQWADAAFAEPAAVRPRNLGSSVRVHAPSIFDFSRMPIMKQLVLSAQLAFVVLVIGAWELGRPPRRGRSEHPAAALGSRRHVAFAPAKRRISGRRLRYDHARGQGYVPLASESDDFAKFIGSEIARWTEAAAVLG
jgi:hypothetical protein